MSLTGTDLRDFVKAVRRAAARPRAESLRSRTETIATRNNKRCHERKAVADGAPYLRVRDGSAELQAHAEALNTAAGATGATQLTSSPAEVVTPAPRAFPTPDPVCSGRGATADPKGTT